MFNLDPITTSFCENKLFRDVLKFVRFWNLFWHLGVLLFAAHGPHPPKHATPIPSMWERMDRKTIKGE